MPKSKVLTPYFSLGKPLAVLAVGSLAALSFVNTNSSYAADSNPASACSSLLEADFQTLQDAPTTIMSAQRVAANGDVPAHCVVKGYVSQHVGFTLQLPDRSEWNGKFYVMALGAYGGSSTFMTPYCDESLRRGYACVQQDTGHKGEPLDAIWAYNNLRAEFDYGIRGAHVGTLAGKAITQRYYDQEPEYTYFMGCSGGGKQALVQAHRFPWSYDGIIALEPSNTTVTGIVLLWNALATHDENGKNLFRPEDLQVLHEGAIERCDADDGLVDGIIGGDPRSCDFDPAALQCKKGQSSGCLSARQVEAAAKVYAGPETSDGYKLYFPALPGGELGSFFTGGPTGIDYKTTYWRYMGFLPDAGPSWQPTDFDFDNDHKRTGMMDALLVGSDNPDLRKMQASGAKLMIIQGWEDSALPGPLNTVDYYETVERVIGDRASTQEFARLFMIPGRSHCRGGAGASAIDSIAAMEAWVEKGEAPDMLIGAHKASDPNPKDASDIAGFLSLPKEGGPGYFTRPHYPYPTQARYDGKGDPNDFRSFKPIEPEAE